MFLDLLRKNMIYAVSLYLFIEIPDFIYINDDDSSQKEHLWTLSTFITTFLSRRIDLDEKKH